MTIPHPFILFAFVAALIPNLYCKSVNVTIDDTYGDPVTGTKFTYSDVEWKPGQNCSGCLAQPDPKQARNGTWHDATFNAQPGYVPEPNVPLNATVTFNGHALYVYCIIDENLDQNSDMTFYIDSEPVGSYRTLSIGLPLYDYNVLVYHNDTLAAGPHVFMLSSGHVNGLDALVLLDYVVYTTDIEDTSESPSAPSQASTNIVPTSFALSSQTIAPTSSRTIPIPSITASTAPTTPTDHQGGSTLTNNDATSHATSTSSSAIAPSPPNKKLSSEVTAVLVVVAVCASALIAAGAFLLCRKRRLRQLAPTISSRHSDAPLLHSPRSWRRFPRLSIRQRQPAITPYTIMADTASSQRDERGYPDNFLDVLSTPAGSAVGSSESKNRRARNQARQTAVAPHVSSPESSQEALIRLVQEGLYVGQPPEAHVSSDWRDRNEALRRRDAGAVHRGSEQRRQSARWNGQLGSTSGGHGVINITGYDTMDSFAAVTGTEPELSKPPVSIPEERRGMSIRRVEKEMDLLHAYRRG
ncbi:hypothetical protein CERSUDRAFT_89995 [Gelatoporia subvermispora B]|uniref:Uncharacterized protein n=1 Tax=Ceriporiopsis subvermispora (strain B) TaxID=914234 RepID=M2RAK2_CERS8|nr:hypothetical protein CERSUDRAFT_89995 [Gelatoporia subvermispora B]